MREIYKGDSEDFWAEYFMAQAEQTGHGMTAFEGMPYQRGAGLGSLFKGLFRLILPIGKRAFSTVGREALAAEQTLQVMYYIDRMFTTQPNNIYDKGQLMF